jgi:hypothetical protein
MDPIYMDLSVDDGTGTNSAFASLSVPVTDCEGSGDRARGGE